MTFYSVLKSPLTLSLLAHLMAFIMLFTLGTYIKLPDYSKMLPQKKIELEQLDKNQLEKLRKVGVKKKYLDPQINSVTPSSAKKISKLTLQALKQSILKLSTNMTNIKKISAQSELTLIHKMQRSAIPSKNIIKDHKLSYNNPGFYDHTTFGVNFVPPEGIDINELNSMEKIFYSFNKRINLTFFSSMVKNFERLSKKRPLLKKSIYNEKHLLTGKITYDPNGHIIAIKILQWSVNDNIQEFFEHILKNIKLPNPPKAFSRNKEFYLYFQLGINQDT